MDCDKIQRMAIPFDCEFIAVNQITGGIAGDLSIDISLVLRRILSSPPLIV